MDKKTKKELLKQYKNNEKKKVLDGLPVSKKLLYALFDYVDEKLEEEPCKHNFEWTIKFLEENECDVEKVINWFEENGAGCDCEVFNVEDLLD